MDGSESAVEVPAAGVCSSVRMIAPSEVTGGAAGAGTPSSLPRRHGKMGAPTSPSRTGMRAWLVRVRSWASPKPTDRHNPPRDSADIRPTRLSSTAPSIKSSGDRDERWSSRRRTASDAAMAATGCATGDASAVDGASASIFAAMVMSTAALATWSLLRARARRCCPEYVSPPSLAVRGQTCLGHMRRR